MSSANANVHRQYVRLKAFIACGDTGNGGGNGGGQVISIAADHILK